MFHLTNLNHSSVLCFKSGIKGNRLKKILKPWKYCLKVTSILYNVINKCIDVFDICGKSSTFHCPLPITDTMQIEGCCVLHFWNCEGSQAHSSYGRYYCYFSFRSDRRLLCSLLISGSRSSYINVPFSSKKLATDFTNVASLSVPVLPSLQLSTRLYLSSYLKQTNWNTTSIEERVYIVLTNHMDRGTNPS